MAYKNIFIENNCKLSTKDKQLIILKEIEYSIPLEDINMIIIDDVACNISTKLISKLSENDILVYICDNKHLPKTIILKINSYSRKLKRLKQQLSLPKPVIKRMWQSIIKQKIINQSKSLENLNIKDYTELYNLSYNVQSGDSDNIEAVAAAMYFRKLNFNRGNNDSFINSALNYGYAIVRGMICRTLVSYGFEPCIGLFHHNELNNFNLADDIIECFRPLVDLYILSNISQHENELTPNIKKVIMNVTNQIMLIDNKKYNIQTAIDQMIMSLSTSVSTKSNSLKLPVLTNLEEYIYG